MATLVLSAAGSAIGGALGGSVMGLSSAVIGQAIGASIGSVIDQKVLGAGSRAVETGRVNSFRVMGAAEGANIPQIYGQMRTGGQVIWSSRFREKKSESSVGGKGGRTKVTEFSYSVSLALALCEGEITRIGRVWADGNEISLENTVWRLYRGTEQQLPDPLIEAIEGAGNVPAYRGTAYLVLENLELGDFGNRIPQFNFEVIRRVKELGANPPIDPYETLSAVALVPGTGEYALGTTPVRYDLDKGVSRSANQNSLNGKTDFVAAIDQLHEEMPQVSSASLVVSWFGNDLRCGSCRVRPKIEQNDVDGTPTAWTVSGQTRLSAELISRIDGKSVFGGTPGDASVIEAIQKLNGDGMGVMFYPFVLMDVLPGNTLPDPISGVQGQPAFPWRGRITLDATSADKTADAAVQVAEFFGGAQLGHFSRSGGAVNYSGPDEWGYRRFILHYAHLCAEAGGVASFLIGSELRGLTRIRDASGGFPAVAALIQLAQDVRVILGASVKISYAADWSEYYGYQPGDGSGDLFFNLDDLWASNAIDFIGIDNYMPLSDWRDSSDHADADWGAVYDLEYLRGNVAGGEGYDWYYASKSDRDQQFRTPIEDTAHGEDWVFRYKDLKSWWSQPHFNRPGGIREAQPTAWSPQSKPIWFTELGCPAIDKGTNQPNVFVDEKSSEGMVPYYSTGVRDDFIQYRYFQAHLSHWAEPANNPVSSVYSQPMVNLDQAYVWAYDTRPWPDFPNRLDVWSDGTNFGRGHWVSGRIGAASLASVVTEISARSNFWDVDVSQLHGSVRGYTVDHSQSARQSLQPLMLSHGFECSELDGKIVFKSRAGARPVSLAESRFVLGQGGSPVSYTRSPAAELTSQIKVNFFHSENGYQLGAASAVIPNSAEPTITSVDMPIALSSAEGANVAARFLSEAQVAQDEVSFVLPPSLLSVTVGDVVEFDLGGAAKFYRIDNLEETGSRSCRALRIENGVYAPATSVEDPKVGPSVSVPSPLYAEFMDLPLITGSEVPHAPHIAVAGSPWPGNAAIYVSSDDGGYALAGEVTSPSVVGTTQSLFKRVEPDRWSCGDHLLVRVPAGELQSRSPEDVLNGANLAAIRLEGGSDWELFQFQTAELVGPNSYKLSAFLRGQLGTDAIMPEQYPAGADFVLLDGSSVQPDIAASWRGLDRHYRIGPASLGYDEPSFGHYVKGFSGVGLRPYSPKHLRAVRAATGAIDLSWIRRTRIDGYSWEGMDVPLGETSESYLIRVIKDGMQLAEMTVAEASFSYSLEQQALDGAVAPFDFEIAQVSNEYGPGPFERITFDG